MAALDAKRARQMRFGIRPASRRAQFERNGGAVLVLIAAAIAAVAAHIGIDVAGDYLLPHDAYDDIAHGSRTIVSLTALGIAGGAAVRLLGSIFARLRTARAPDFTPVMDPRTRWIFLGCVIAATFGLLMAMEMIDLVCAGEPIDDVRDLLGGSVGLAALIALPAACAAGLAILRIARWAYDAERVGVRIVTALLLAQRRTVPMTLVACGRPTRSFAPAPALTRRAAKRGPPASLR